MGEKTVKETYNYSLATFSLTHRGIVAELTRLCWVSVFRLYIVVNSDGFFFTSPTILLLAVVISCISPNKPYNKSGRGDICDNIGNNNGPAS